MINNITEAVKNITSNAKTKLAAKSVLNKTRKFYKDLIEDEKKRNLRLGAQKSNPKFYAQYCESCEIIRTLNAAYEVIDIKLIESIIKAIN